MTFFEIIKLGLRNKFIILIVIIFCVTAGVFFNQRQSQNNVEGTLYLTLGVLDQYQNTSSYENIQAAELATESVQGWFKDPSFQTAVDQKTGITLGIKAKKQEKNNLIVNFYSSSQEDLMTYGNMIISELASRLENFNSKSDLKITLAGQNFFFSTKQSQLQIYLFLSVILGLILGYLGALIYETASDKLKSNAEFTQSTGISNIFNFSNEKDIKKHHHFLVKNLNEKYHNQKVQLIDLTHKSKVGLEIISKYSDFAEIKSFDLPKDINKININWPTVIIAELGHTKKSTLKYLGQMSFPHLEGVVFNQI